MTTVSILIPIYNEIHFIDKTVQSVIGEADEIILCDNASTDGTSDICSAYAARYPEIKYTRHTRNLGWGANFSECMSRATGRYIRLMGGHDLISKFSTQSMLALMRSMPNVGLVYPGFIARLNADYTIARCYPSCSFADGLKSSSPFERIQCVFENLSDCSLYYGLYDAQLLRELIVKYSVFSIFSDHSTVAAIAGRSAVLADNTSIFYRMDPRVTELNGYERLLRIAKSASGGDCDNPFLWLFIVLCEGYGLIREMQSWEGAPPDFMQNATAILLRRFGGKKDVPVNRDGFPAVLPGREALADEVFALALDYEAKVQNTEHKKIQKEYRKIKNQFRLAAYALLTKLPETNLTGALRKRLEKKLRRKRLLK